MKRILCFVISCLVAITTTTANATDYNNIYISLDGVNPSPNDVNIIAGTSKTIYIISTVDRISYLIYWGTYWGTAWGTNWGNHWDRPWEQVVMNVPIALPAAGSCGSVRDLSFDPKWGDSYDYELFAWQPTFPPQIPAGVHFSTVLTAIGEPNDKFGIEILEGEEPWPLIQEVVFTIVRECNDPYILTINVEPNDVNTIQPGVGQHEYCPGRNIPLIASSYANCPAVYQFDHWVGDVNDVNSANTTILIDGNKTIIGYFIDKR
jgi:hypothetical protein